MTPDTMPDGFPIERAKDWIGRWKAAGGGFFCHPNEETGEVMVQLASQGSLLDEPEVRNRKAEKIQSLQDELLKEPALKSAITTLVAATWRWRAYAHKATRNDRAPARHAGWQGRPRVRAPAHADPREGAGPP